MLVVRDDQHLVGNARLECDSTVALSRLPHSCAVDVRASSSSRYPRAFPMSVTSMPSISSPKLPRASSLASVSPPLNAPRSLQLSISSPSGRQSVPALRRQWPDGCQPHREKRLALLARTLRPCIQKRTTRALGLTDIQFSEEKYQFPRPYLSMCFPLQHQISHLSLSSFVYNDDPTGFSTVAHTPSVPSARQSATTTRALT